MLPPDEKKKKGKGRIGHASNEKEKKKMEKGKRKKGPSLHRFRMGKKKTPSTNLQRVGFV